MNREYKKVPELVAPAQDWSSLEVLPALADAVYFGVENYNMRAQAKNFDSKDLKKIIEFCHSQSPRMKAYLCTNILIYDSELNDLEKLILEAKDAEIDAIIAHDIAAISIAKKNNLKFHISTQANVSNAETANFYEELGAERIILARELSLNHIGYIKNQLKKSEIECFVHGAMCTMISGRCYFSATICDSVEKSGNRGNCVQPCRRHWTVIDNEKNEFVCDGQLFFNAKDLCTIEYIPSLIEKGIDAFKIEGRMKDPIYIKTVTVCYREAIDSFFDGSYSEEKIKNWLERLSKVHNRGFHTGFYFHRPTAEDIELEKSGNISPYKKRYIGMVLSYNDRSKTANVLLETSLSVGNEIIIIGKNTYHIEKIIKMFLKGDKVDEVKRENNDSPIKVNICISKEVRSNDKIYVISKV